MTSHERDLILKVADEVRTADRATVDPEAERLIRAEVGAQPHAAYLLTQRVIVQDLALQQAQSRIDELQARLRQAGVPAGGTTGAAPNQTEPPPSGRSGVGDFLRTAAAAAAGTIGGQLIYDGLRNWAAEQGGGHGSGGLLGGLAGSGFGGRRATDFDADRTRVDDTEERDEGGGGDFGAEPDDEDGTGAGGDWGDDQDADDGADQGDGSGGDW